MTAIVVDMNVSRPYGPISYPLDSAVLHVLAGTTGGLTGRNVARLAKEGTQQGIWKALRRLVDEGIVDQEEAGNANLYRLNRSHLAAAPIEQLVNLRGELLNRIAEAFASWECPPVHASMFGSAARGDGDADSDIDLFVVRPESIDAENLTWRRQVDHLASDVKRWTGNRASIADVSERDLPGLIERRPPIVDQLGADALTVTGPDIMTILRVAE
jgi:predicted nucleotidyltransferase